MSDNLPKKFTVIRAESDVDISKLRDEKIGNVLNESIKREYKFHIDPKLASEQPILLIMPDSETDHYWRTLLESISTLNKDIADIIDEDSPKNSMQNELKSTLTKMSNIMNHIVNSDSWKNNNLSDVDKKDINEMLNNLIIPDSL